MLRRAEQIDRDEDAAVRADRRGDELPAEAGPARETAEEDPGGQGRAGGRGAGASASRRERIPRRRSRRRRPSGTSPIRSRRSRRPRTASFRATTRRRRWMMPGDRGAGRDADGGGRGRSCCRGHGDRPDAEAAADDRCWRMRGIGRRRTCTSWRDRASTPLSRPDGRSTGRGARPHRADARRPT